MNGMGKAKGSVEKAIFGIVFFSIAGNLLGLVRESTLAAYFGASAISDAYKISFTVPYTLTALVSAAINTTFIPVYTEFRKKKPDEQVRYFLNNVFNSTAGVTLIISLIGMPFAAYVVNIIAPGFKPEIFNLTVKLTIIMLPSIIFLCLANLASGYLQSNNRFIAASLTGIPFNLFIIGSVLVSPDGTIEPVAIGSLLGMAGQFFVQLPSMVKAGYWHSPVIFDFREEGIKKILVLSMPVLIGSLFNHFSSTIEKVLASGLAEGSISALDYAGRVTGNINNLFILSIVTVVFPHLSHLADNLDVFNNVVLKTMRIIAFTAIPAVTGVFILRVPVVRLLYERGEFTPQDTYITSIVLGCLAISILFTGVDTFLIKAFYALKDTRTPVINNITGVLINIALSLIFIRFWAVAGLALAASFSSMFKCCMLLIKYRIKTKSVLGKDFILPILKALLASSVMGIAVQSFSSFYYRNFTGNHSFIWDASGLMLNTIIGLGVYLAAMHALRSEELKYFFGLISDRFHFSVKSKK